MTFVLNDEFFKGIIEEIEKRDLIILAKIKSLIKRIAAQLLQEFYIYKAVQIVTKTASQMRMIYVLITLAHVKTMAALILTRMVLMMKKISAQHLLV
jgi:hypothetical protein